MVDQAIETLKKEKESLLEAIKEKKKELKRLDDTVGSKRGYKQISELKRRVIELEIATLRRSIIDVELLIISWKHPLFKYALPL